MIDYIILGGMIIDFVMTRKKPKIGALTNYVVTTIVLIWGIYSYYQGVKWSIFGREISHIGFLIMIFIWYIIDTKIFLEFRK